MTTLYAFVQTDQAIPALDDYHIHFQIAVSSHSTSKFGSKDILLWKKGSAFVSREDENLDSF